MQGLAGMFGPILQNMMQPPHNVFTQLVQIVNGRGVGKPRQRFVEHILGRKQPDHVLRQGPELLELKVKLMACLRMNVDMRIGQWMNWAQTYGETRCHRMFG